MRKGGILLGTKLSQATPQTGLKMVSQLLILCYICLNVDT